MLAFGDGRIFLLCLAGFVGVLALAWFGLRLVGIRVPALLTKREWRLVGKLAAILALAMVLFQTHLARDLPAELFLYGRF